MVNMNAWRGSQARRAWYDRAETFPHACKPDAKITKVERAISSLYDTWLRGILCSFRGHTYSRGVFLCSKSMPLRATSDLHDRDAFSAKSLLEYIEIYRDCSTSRACGLAV